MSFIEKIKAIACNRDNPLMDMNVIPAPVKGYGYYRFAPSLEIKDISSCMFGDIEGMMNFEGRYLSIKGGQLNIVQICNDPAKVLKDKGLVREIMHYNNGQLKLEI
jgi:hypothetical protein